MRIRGTSLILAVMIVAGAVAGAIWLQDYRQFPWIVFIAVFFPAQIVVVMAAEVLMRPAAGLMLTY